MRASRLRAATTLAALTFAILTSGGCALGRYRVVDPDHSRIIRVESGDRFYFDLPERGDDGERWEAQNSDPDIEVLVEHEPEDGEAHVRVRVHRGYDGPSTVYFHLRRPDAKKPSRTFALTLFRQTQDAVPFWD